MKVKELIEMLSKMNPEADVTYSDDGYATDIHTVEYIEFGFDPDDGQIHDYDWNDWLSAFEPTKTVMIN